MGVVGSWPGHRLGPFYYFAPSLRVLPHTRGTCMIRWKDKYNFLNGNLQGVPFASFLQVCPPRTMHQFNYKMPGISIGCSTVWMRSDISGWVRYRAPLICNAKTRVTSIGYDTMTYYHHSNTTMKWISPPLHENVPCLTLEHCIGNV